MLSLVNSGILRRWAAQLVRTMSNPALEQKMILQSMENCGEATSKALIVGVYADEDNINHDAGLLTPTAFAYDKKTNGALGRVLRMTGRMPKIGESRVLFGVEAGLGSEFSAVAVVGLGRECQGYNPYEVMDEQKETIRRTVGAACMKLAEMQIAGIDIDTCGHAESAAEGAALGIWIYQDLIEKKRRLMVPAIELYSTPGEPCDMEGWRIGIQKAAAQNLTRHLQEMPSNLMTPTSFAQYVVDVLCKSGVNVEAKVEGWAESQSMNAFLSVAKSSCEQPIFMELSYYGTCATERPIVLIGQGITYDCGGLCLKRRKELYHMRGDMTGAAVVVSAMRCIAHMRLPINIRGLIPLCENVIGCNSFRPGDITKAMNGKHIQVEGTDHEDVLVLADALLYAQNCCPKFILDIGTTSGYMRNALDEAACGVFTNSEILWQQIKQASMHTGDRVWRFPVWDYYSSLVRGGVADVRNYGSGRGGRPCKAAAFLREFVPCGQWMHIDATNVMVTNGRNFEYLRRGMAGRPTRTVIEFIAQTFCLDTAPKFPKPVVEE